MLSKVQTAIIRLRDSNLAVALFLVGLIALAGPSRAETPVAQLLYEMEPSSVSIRTQDNSTTFIAGVSLTLVADVSPWTPGGYIYFYDGATLLGSASIFGNSASLTVSFPTGSSPHLTAVFPGDPFHYGSSSGTLILTELFDTTKENLALNTAQNRMRHLFLDQPDLTQFLLGTAAKGLDITASGKNGTITGFGTLGPLWFRLAGSRSDDGSASSHYALLSVGGHAEVGTEAILGLMGQIDSIGYSDATGSATGTGWLVGPYGVTRLGTLPLWLEGRLLWGKSRNHIRLEGQADETIPGDRFLGLVKLSGDFGRDDLTLRPFVSFGHGSESFDLYTTSQGVPILGTSASRTEASLGLDFTSVLASRVGSLRLDGAFGLVRVTEDTGDQDGTTLRLRLGLDHTADSGLRSYIHLIGQGGGSLDARTYGLDLGLALTF